MQRLSKVARIILVGAPGVGKGTQAERMMKRYPQLSQLSSGDLLRDNVRRKTPLGIQAESTMKRGGLVPDATILRLILAELTNRGWLRTDAMKPLTLNMMAPDAVPEPVEENFMPSLPLNPESYEYSNSPSASFILDGFPRTAGQAEQLDRLIPINFVVQIQTPFDVVVDRISNRWVHPPSGRVYNTTFNAPKVAGKDDITGEPLTRRADDEPETVKARLRKFQETSEPLLEHYDKQRKLWTVKGNTSDEISPQLFTEFEQRFCASA